MDLHNFTITMTNKGNYLRGLLGNLTFSSVTKLRHKSSDSTPEISQNITTLPEKGIQIAFQKDELQGA